MCRRVDHGPSPALSAPSGADSVRRELARWSVAVDHRYSRHVSDDVGEIHEGSELERSFADGGDDAVRDAYDRYGAMVYTFCRRTVGHDDAIELAQDVFVAAWRSRSSYDATRGGLGGWLMAIARNKAIDHLRRQGRRPQIAVGDIEDLDGSGPDDVDMLANRMLLAEALGELAPRARQVVELAFWHDLTHEQIAAKTHLPLGTIKSDVRRSLPLLKRAVAGMTSGATDE